MALKRRRSGPFQILRARRRAGVRRAPFIVLALATMLLIILDQSGVRAAREVRVWLLEATAPAVSLMAQPVYFVRNILENIEHLAELRTENEDLRMRVTDLERLAVDYDNLKSENRILRQQLNFIPQDSFGFITAPVIADGAGAFARSVIIKAGRAAGARKGQAVMTGDGLVGRVHEVGPHTSRVVLLEDLNSRIPVMILETRDRAVLAGNNSRQPSLIYIAENARIGVGTKVVTSGDGGVFPQGLPVGRVASIRDNEIRVELFADLSRLDFVKIVDYGLTGLLQEDD